MYSVHDTPKGWVAPFGHPGIKACSQLLRDFRSVPRPSSPPGAKASTECPSLAQSIQPTQEQPPTPTGAKQKPPPPDNPTRVRDQSLTHTHTHFNAPEPCNTTAFRQDRPNRPDPHGSDKPYGSHHGQTRSPRPARPRVQRPSPTGEKTELSCAPRSAPEPDSHVKKTKLHGTNHQTSRPTAVTRGKPAPISIPNQPFPTAYNAMGKAQAGQRHYGG